MKYIGYCRKSTDESDRQILSIESQIAELKEFANRNNLDVIDIVCEARTAKIPGRPYFNEVLARIENGEAQGIISWHPDRLARNSIDGGKIIYSLDTGQLIDLKFPSFWFENSPQGKFVLNIAFGQSKYYVDNLSENVKRGLKTLLRNGVMPHKPPLGYIYNKSLKKHEVDLVKSKIIKNVFQKYSVGDWSQIKIAKYLFLNGFSKGNGKQLSLNNVLRLLTNKFYIGIFKFSGEWYQGTHEKFISKTLFDKVQKQLSLNIRKSFQKRNFAFKGLMKCGECGASITCEEHINNYKNGRSQHLIYYRCTKKLKPCTQKFIRQEEVDLQLRKIISDVAIPVAWVPKWEKLIEKRLVIENQNQELNIQNLESESKSIDLKLNLLLDGFLDNTIDGETYKAKKNDLFEKKLKLQEEIGKIKVDGSIWLEPLREFMEVSKNCGKIALAKNNSDEVATIGKNIGSNFFLMNRHLTTVFKKGYNTAFLALSRVSPRELADSHSLCERVAGIEY